MSVPNTFASATSAIPLANLDADFAYYDAAFQISGTAMEVNYTFRLEDPTDNTKKAEFVMSGITTGTTRQYTMPNASGTLATLANTSQTFLGSTVFAPSTNSGTITIGGIPQTGTVTLGRSTASQTVDIAVGATTAVSTKTVNIGTTGVSGSTTNINFGSAVSGALVTQTWNAGANSMRFDSSGNLGIGTTSPGAKLDVNGAITMSAAAATKLTWNYSGAYSNWIECGGVAGNNYMRFATGNTEAMRLDSSGNLGVGATAPTSKLNVSVTSNGVLSNNISINNPGSGLGTGAKISLGWSDGASGYTAAIGGFYDGVGTSLSFLTNPSLNGTQTERMRLDSSGNLLVGTTTSAGAPAQGICFIPTYTSANAAAIAIGHITGTATGATYVNFAYAGASIGSITQNGTTAVAYNTSSDYRLKNITGPITTSGVYIDSLKPVEGTWKADGSTFVGLIAHETQEASRTTVATGIKDGDEMQGMDYSSAEIIANLIAELQDLRKRLAAAGI